MKHRIEWGLYGIVPSGTNQEDSLDERRNKDWVSGIRVSFLFSAHSIHIPRELETALLTVADGMQVDIVGVICISLEKPWWRIEGYTGTLLGLSLLDLSQNISNNL